jgi:hypothetical protein
VIGSPSILSVIREAGALVRVLSTLFSGWTRTSCDGSGIVHGWVVVLLFVKSPSFFYFYYESRKRELKTRPTYECRCDERLKSKVEESTRLSHTLGCSGFLCTHTSGSFEFNQVAFCRCIRFCKQSLSVVRHVPWISGSTYPSRD